MKLLANENFPFQSVRILRDAGYDITAAGTDFSGRLDNEIIEIAQRENRTILTFDKDYGELIFRKGYRPQAGVIFMRWDDFQPEEPGRYLIELFKSKQIQFEGFLTVVSVGTIRQRKFL
ncbi:MAG: DUF5615 family PIN-like protein [Bacteroidales bacterium]|nr:DUF5615 family PIN-like protein [Bacteroidales bacterium]